MDKRSSKGQQRDRRCPCIGSQGGEKRAMEQGSSQIAGMLSLRVGRDREIRAGFRPDYRSLVLNRGRDGFRKSALILRKKRFAKTGDCFPKEDVR